MKTKVEELEALIEECETGLAEMSRRSAGVRKGVRKIEAQTPRLPLLRSLWSKLTQPLRAKAPFDSKGMRHE